MDCAPSSTVFTPYRFSRASAVSSTASGRVETRIAVTVPRSLYGCAAASSSICSAGSIAVKLPP